MPPSVRVQGDNATTPIGASKSAPARDAGNHIMGACIAGAKRVDGGKGIIDHVSSAFIP